MNLSFQVIRLKILSPNFILEKNLIKNIKKDYEFSQNE